MDNTICENITYIKLTYIYINNLNEVEKISQEIYNMVTPNLISKEEIIKLLKNNINTREIKKYTISSLLQYNVDIETGEYAENYLNEKPHSSLATYAMTKKILLQAAISCELQYNMKWLSFVPSTLYGINYVKSNKQNHFIFDLIKKILRGKILGKKVVLWGDGNQKREIIHIKDFINNMILVNSVSQNNLYNIGAGESYPIKYFAKIICRIIGYDFKKIKFDRSKYVGAKFKKLSIKKISKLNINYKKNLIHLHDGLKEVIEWHIRNKRY
jgi:nucleoside-diphosphate-sugar epimerase